MARGSDRGGMVTGQIDTCIITVKNNIIIASLVLETLSHLEIAYSDHYRTIASRYEREELVMTIDK